MSGTAAGDRAAPSETVVIFYNPATAPYHQIYVEPFKAGAAIHGVEPVVAAYRDLAELDTIMAASAKRTECWADRDAKRLRQRQSSGDFGDGQPLSASYHLCDPQPRRLVP